MHTIEIEISEQLAHQLLPYHQELPALLEAGLRSWQRQRKQHRQSLVTAAQIREALVASGKVIVPDPALANEPYVRHTPVAITGQPGSEIVIEQRKQTL